MLLINHLHPRAGWQHLVFFSLLAHDALGRMTHDGTSNLDITYNYLDMPEKISRNDTLLGMEREPVEGAVPRSGMTAFVRRPLDAPKAWLKGRS